MQIGKFEVLGELGKGAGSTIVKIKRAADGKLYALKMISRRSSDDDKFIEQAQHEYAVLSQLDHKNVVKGFAFEVVRGFFRVKGARLLLELVDGLPLGECKDLPVGKLVYIFHKTASGLTYLHSMDYLLADLKPDNIMVNTEGKVKLIDFGLCWQRGEKRKRIQGTIEFLAPEQARKRVVTVKTDIFNFGATMYRMLIGKPVPNMRETTMKALGNLDKLVRPLSELNPAVPAELDELVRHCLRYNPDDRPASMNEVKERIKQIEVRR